MQLLRTRRRWSRPHGCNRLLTVALALDGPQPPEIADDFFLDAPPHVLEELEAFFLVFDQRIALAVAAQADAFLEVIERVEVVLPLRVDDLQHQIALDAAHQVGRDDLFLLLVLGPHPLPEHVAQLFGAAILEADLLVVALGQAKDLGEVALERVEIPLVLVESLPAN